MGETRRDYKLESQLTEKNHKYHKNINNRECTRGRERRREFYPQKGIHCRTSSWAATSMISKHSKVETITTWRPAKTLAVCQGGSCGSTSNPAAQKQWKTGTKQNLGNEFFQIRSSDAEMLILVVAAVPVQALPLSAGTVQELSLHSRVAASSPSFFFRF